MSMSFVVPLPRKMGPPQTVVWASLLLIIKVVCRATAAEALS